MKNQIQKNRRRKKRGLKPKKFQTPIGYNQQIARQLAY